MHNPAIKQALLKALAGRPVSSLTPAPKPTPKAAPRRAAPVEAPNHARFMKAFHGLPGYKHKAQCETLRDRVALYIVPTKKRKGCLPNW